MTRPVTTIRSTPNAWTQVLALAVLALGVAATAPGQTPPSNPAPSQESTTPVEPVPALPIAKPTLPFPDRSKFSSLYVKDFTRSPSENPDEYAIYNSLLLHARNFTAEQLLAAGRKDVSYADLLSKEEEHRDSYRYEIIRFDGRLIRLKKIPSTPELVAQGVPELYEAWFFPTRDNKPVCALLIDPPEGVEPNLVITSNRTISVGGYFYKDLAFTSDEKASKEGNTVTRFAPLIFSKGMVVQPVSDSEAGNVWRTSFLPMVFITIGLLTVFVLGLTWYFRRGDRISKRAVEAKRINPYESSNQYNPPVEPGDWDSFTSERR